MQQYLDALIEWTRENDMVINSAKTTEIIMGRIDVSELSLALCTKTVQIQRVHSFKLLGVNGGIHVDESLTWNCNIDYISQLRRPNVCFLKVIKVSEPNRAQPPSRIYNGP